MIPFIKKYKFFIITAAAIVAALVIAFAAGNPERNNINNTRIIKDNKTSAFPKRETIEETKRRLGF